MSSTTSTARLVMPYKRWELQWLRCWRWYHRLGDAIGRGDGPGVVGDAPDFAEALCQAVWHLKDWLKLDPDQTVVTGAQVEEFANGDDTLRLIADLGNGSKHLGLTGNGDRSKTVTWSFLMWTGDGDYDDPASVTEVDVSIELEGERTVQVIDLATDAMAAWAQWLTDQGLDVPADPDAGQHAAPTRRRFR